ncbi:putative barnase/colicin E5 family endoribonuclease, partial [Helicobacter trogontum]|uniref:putative barnase/colicin E5 family endoribonuclease n=1 Tax=Helicobacter trogontum TaxID=50960 RepID=UPI0034E899ED
MKQDTQGLIPYNRAQANNALIPYNRAQDPKLLAGNEAKLLEYKQTLNTLQKLEKSFKDFMSLPFSIIVDSKGNALPLTSQAIKNFIFHNLYKEFMSATKALNKPLAQLDFKPLSNEIKALPYKANANLKAHLRDINAKTNELLDSMQELKKSTKEIKLLAYHKPSENNANEVDRFRNVLGEISKTREYQVITDKKAFIENLNVLKRVAEPIPPTLDIQSFLKTLDNVENKENFIEHLSTRQDSQARLAYLNLVEPTLKRADIELTFLPNKKEYIKSFKDKDNNLLYLLVTKDNDKTLITGIPNPAERYVKSEINKADIIHSFVPQDRQTTEVVNGLSTQNPTTKQEISKEIESKTTQDIEKKARMRRGIYSVYYEDIMIDFRKKYDPDDTLWFMKYAKLEKSDNGEQVYAALKHLNEIRDNVFIKYDDYVAATEKLTSSLKRAALDIIFETKDVSEAFEGIAKIETKLLDDYPFNQKRDTIQKENGITPSIKDTQQKERDKIIHSDSLIKGETLPLNSKENSTIKTTSELEKPTTKNYSLLRDNGFVKDMKKHILKNEQIAKEFNIYAKRFEKEGDKQAAEDMQATAQDYKERAQKLREELPRIIEFEGYKPLSEFGTNYAEFYKDGKGAIQKLLEERQGQVAGAFYKEELEKLSGNGDIDLVWGEVTDAINHKGYGLAHILDKRKAEFIEKGFSNTEAEHKTLELIKKIPSVIDNGQIVDLKNGKIRIVTEDYTIGMKNEWHDNPTNPYILTTFENNKKSDKNLHSTAFTKGETLPLNSKEDSTIKNTNPIQNTATLQNPSIEFALQEFPEFSKAELEEMLTKGIRGEARTTEGFTKQHIEYIKDNTRYSGEIANYRDEELGMYGDTFHLAKLQKTENVIDPTNWEASLKTLLDKALILGKDKDTLQQAQDLMDSIRLNNPSFLTSLNPNYPKIKEILNEYQERLNTLIAQSPQDIKFIDTKGKEHTLTKEVQEQWLETFNLKSLDEAYIPNFTPEVKQALDSILQGEQIKLTSGSLLKLMQRDRLEFLPYIKDTLESPQVVVRQVDGALIFAKDFRDDKLGKFFASVSKNDSGEWVISSNAPKNLNNLQNKIKEGGEVLYSDLPELPIIAKPDLTAKALNSEANLSDIIPQTTQEIIKQAKASGKSVAETKELLQKHKEKDSIQDNPQVSALQTKIQQTRQQIAESKNPDKEYLHQVFKPDEIIQLEKQYFNQAMPQEYKELIQDFPRLYEQSLANKLKTYVKDTDTIQEVTTNLLNNFKDKPFKDTAKHAELLLFNVLKDKAQELGFKELDINEPSFKVAFGKFQARLKKGDIQDLSEHIAINSLRKDRLRIQEKLNIKPLKEFGTNYAEHYHSGESAIAKLLAERQGQVAGAFHKEGLGDIDLVWGDSKKGLAHILERRTDDFIKQGLSKEEAEAKAKEFVKEIPQIIENGEVVENAGVKTIILKDKNIEHRVGLSKGFNGKGENEWILTAYKRENPHAQNFDQATNSKELESGNNLSLIDSAPNLSTKEIIKQAKEQGLSQVQSNTNAQQLTLHDIQERLTARKKELEQQSKDLSTELKTQEKQANRVAPILKELLQKWRALNPLIIEWKERKEIRGKFGQFLGYEKKLSKRKPNLSNLEHIEKTLEAYKSYAKNNEDSAESVKKEISLLEDYVEKLKNKQNKQNIQNLIEH